jgi:hypothetical protein
MYRWRLTLYARSSPTFMIKSYRKSRSFQKSQSVNERTPDLSRQSLRQKKEGRQENSSRVNMYGLPKTRWRHINLLIQRGRNFSAF